MAEPRFLLPEETPRVDTIRHPAVLLAPGSRAGAVLLVLLFLWDNSVRGTFADLLALGMLAVIGWFVWKVAEWRHDHFLVTEKRVLLVTGLLTKRVGMMPLMKVTDMTYERSWLGLQLGYGAFVMESAGQDQALHRIDFVPRPEEVSQTMFALLFGGPAPARGGPQSMRDLDQTDPNLPVLGPEDLQAFDTRTPGDDDAHPSTGK